MHLNKQAPLILFYFYLLKLLYISIKFFCKKKHCINLEERLNEYKSKKATLVIAIKKFKQNLLQNLL